jgi:transposase-like protein
MRGLENPFNTRLQMVRLARSEKGISFASRSYETTRNTVRKWIDRYRKEALSLA